MQKQQTRIQMGNVYKANTKLNVIFILDMKRDFVGLSMDNVSLLYFFSKWDKTFYSRHTIIQMKNCDFVVNFCYLGCVCVCGYVLTIIVSDRSVSSLILSGFLWCCLNSETFTWNVMVARWRAMMKGLQLTANSWCFEDRSKLTLLKWPPSWMKFHNFKMKTMENKHRNTHIKVLCYFYKVNKIYRQEHLLWLK